MTSRVVWDVHGNRREEDTYSTVSAQYRHILAQRNELLRESALSDTSAADIRKGVARNVRLSPELSLAIREHIVQADVLILLVTSMCLFRSWIDYEVELATHLGIPVYAVLASGTAMGFEGTASKQTSELCISLEQRNDPGLPHVSKNILSGALGAAT